MRRCFCVIAMIWSVCISAIWAQSPTPWYCTGICRETYTNEIEFVACPDTSQGQPCTGGCTHRNEIIQGGCDQYNMEPTTEVCNNAEAYFTVFNIVNGQCANDDQGPPHCLCPYIDPGAELQVQALTCYTDACQTY